MLKRIFALGMIAICLLTAGCSGGGGAQQTPSATADTTPQQTPAATASAEAQGSPTQQSAELSVLFINAGYGDAALIQTNGKAYLVDTGAKDAVPALYRALAMRGVDALDGLFLTHTHSDHTGGAEALAQRCNIDTLYSAEISMDKDSGKNVIDELAEELALPHMKLRAGDVVEIGGGAYFEVLGPLVYNSEDDNDNSLVMKLHAGGITVLLTGDMQFAQEQTLLDADTDLTADVLKVGNHGNQDATSDAFASAVGADIAVISTSTAQDGDTPGERVLAALGRACVAVTQEYSAGVLLTAQNGQIALDDPQAPAADADIAIQAIDRDAQTIALINNGADADIAGYFIISEKGSEIFVFPEGAALAAGETLTVACIGGAGDYIWNDNKVWSDKEDEAGVLFDAYGNMLSRRA